jgi:hypothetical protein
MMEHVPVVVLDDGTTFLLLMEKDMRFLPAGILHIHVEAERSGDGILIWLPGQFEATFRIDRKSEMDIRRVGSLGVRLITDAGIFETGRSMEIQWPLGFPRRRRRSAVA